VRALEKLVRDLGGEVPKDLDLVEVVETQSQAETHSQSEVFSQMGEEEESKDNWMNMLSMADKEMLEEKLDEIEILKGLLQKEKEKLHQYEMKVADLKVELDEANAKLQKVEGEKESF
jgi:DNA repair exonuclease SbcCD ATPase subunit